MLLDTKFNIYFCNFDPFNSSKYFIRGKMFPKPYEIILELWKACFYPGKNRKSCVPKSKQTPQDNLNLV